MSLFDTTSQPPLGLQASQSQRLRVICRAGAGEKGQIWRFDMAGSDGDVTAGSLIDGTVNSPTANVLAATASHDGPGFVLVVLDEAIVEDGEGWAVLRGLVQVQAAGSTDPNVGLPFSVGASSRATTMVQHARACGIAREAGASAGGLIWANFNGVEGLGVKSDS